jgi:hypothetical protein
MASEDNRNREDSCPTCHLLRDVPADELSEFTLCLKHTVRPADSGPLRSYRCRYVATRLRRSGPVNGGIFLRSILVGVRCA